MSNHNSVYFRQGDKYNDSVFLYFDGALLWPSSLYCCEYAAQTKQFFHLHERFFDIDNKCYTNITIVYCSAF